MSVSTSKRKRAKIAESEQERLLADTVFGKDLNFESSTEPLRSESLDETTQEDSLQANSADDAKETEAHAAVWQDDDDEDVEVNLLGTDRLRKLIKVDQKQSTVSGTELSSLLQERFKTKTLDWATADTDGDDPYDGDDIMRGGAQLLDTKKSDSVGRPLAPGRVDMLRLPDANVAEPSQGAITAVDFHSSGSVMLTGSGDSNLRVFRVDGDKNEKQLSVSFDGMAIGRARFLGTSSEIVVSGRRAFFHSYDLESGNISKYPGLHTRGLKSHENMAVSPEGSRIAFNGGSGYVHVCCGKQKSWIADVKMNCAVRASAFLDETTLVTGGLDADVYLWDLRFGGRCVGKFHNEDGTCISSLTASRSRSCLAVGAESGVMTVYDMTNRSRPTALKSALNLTTKIDSLAFHPSSQIIAFSSSEKVDNLRLMHMPSCSVFTNWPTEKTPLRRVQCMTFSPGGSYFAAGNNKGRVVLYKLNHFVSS